LAHNELSTIEDGAFEDVSLKSGILDLSFNKLTTIGQHLFTGLKVTVKGTSSGPILRMDYCEIEEIETGAFDITTPFKELHMRYNHIRRLSASMFGGGDKALIAVTMDHNLLEFVPQLNATKLKLMSINDNQITQIRDEDLRVYTSLERLEIEKNPPLSFIHPNAFNGFKKLSVVKLAGGSLKALPIFKGATALGDIDASSNQLTSFPAEICTHCPNLYLLFLGGNRLTSLPQLGNCSILEYLHLHDNPIGNLPNDALEGNLHLRSIVLSNTSMTVLPPNLIKNKRRLTKLDVRRNGITEIPRAFFAEAFELRDLYLSHNRISVLGPGVFHNVSYLDNLEFTHNNLRYIDEEAWHNLTFHFLTKLNLSDNVELTHIPTPGDGFPHLKDLSLTNCPKLERVPPPEMTSRLVTAEYTYGYHCCLWTSQTHPNWMSKEKIEPWFDNIPIKNYGGKLETIPTPPRTSPTPVSSTTSTSPSFTVGTRDLLDVLLREYGAKTYGHNVTVTFSPFNPSTESPPVRIHPANSLKDFTCIPRVSQFAPCEDMMGSWALRVCVWAVVILTVFGNAAVLFVLVASRKSMDVPQFLVCNLAFADLCLGVYLAFISVVDLQTQGNGRFYLSAIPWQNGPGCKTAGFFAIFATELSVYSLVLITFERLYTISNVMKQKQIGIKMAVLLVGIGWVIAIITALLPLLNVGVNSYSSVCVCLPFLHEGIGDRLYLIFIVTFNLLAFVLIVAFYVRIYWLTRKTQAVNSGPSDRKLIRSILMLTIVDFLCWVPLSVITLAVVGGKSDILDISVSKWLVVLIFPINACANPFLYAIFTKKFREHIKTLVCCSNKSNFPFRPNQYQSRDQQRPQYAQRRASISIAEFHRRLSTSSLEMSSQQRARSNSIQPLLNHYSGNTSVMSSSDHTSMTSVGSSILHHGRRSSLPSTLLTTPPQRDGSHAPSLSQDSEIQYLNGVYTHLVPPINFSRSGSLPNLNEEESVGHASLSHRTLSPNEHHPPLATLMEASNENVPGMELGPSRESRSHGKVGHGEGEGQREEDASLVRSEDSRDADMDQKPTRVHTSPSTDSGHVTNFKASTSCSSHLSTRSSPLPTLSPPATPPHVSECLFNRSPVYGREPTDGFDSSALCHGLHSLWTKEHGLERPDHTDTTPSPPGLPNATPMPVTSDCTTTVNGDVVSGYYSNTTVYLKSPPYPYNALEWEDMETDV
jgi:leucine-rich repeat-containing G protein-coupled receptor 6